MAQFTNQSANLGILAGHIGIIADATGNLTANSIIFDNIYTKVVRCENAINASSLNVLSATVNTLTSSAGANLVIASPTGVIDFGNATFTNFAGISRNPRRFDIVSPVPVLTTDATPTTLYPIPTVTDTAYTLNTDVTTTDNVNSAASGINVKCIARNIGGTVTISAITTTAIATDAPLTGIVVDYVVSGTNVNARITGLAARNCKWFGATVATIQEF
jgi:hypothetical protein